MQKTSPISRPPDPLIDAMQTGDRLGYHPENAKAEIEHFHEVLPKAHEALQAEGQAIPQREQAIVKQAEQWGKTHPEDAQAAAQYLKQMKEHQQQRAEALDSAVKLMNDVNQ
jgi:hypothetical protein